MRPGFSDSEIGVKVMVTDLVVGRAAAAAAGGFAEEEERSSSMEDFRMMENFPPIAKKVVRILDPSMISGRMTDR